MFLPKLTKSCDYNLTKQLGNDISNEGIIHFFWQLKIPSTQHFKISNGANRWSETQQNSTVEKLTTDVQNVWTTKEKLRQNPV